VTTDYPFRASYLVEAAGAGIDNAAEDSAESEAVGSDCKSLYSSFDTDALAFAVRDVIEPIGPSCSSHPPAYLIVSRLDSEWLCALIPEIDDAALPVVPEQKNCWLTTQSVGGLGAKR
jgi:hypothetical protein